jgi:hypothetical protein
MLVRWEGRGKPRGRPGVRDPIGSEGERVYSLKACQSNRVGVMPQKPAGHCSVNHEWTRHQSRGTHLTLKQTERDRLTVLETFAPSELSPRVRIESCPLYCVQVLRPGALGSRRLTKLPHRAETSWERAVCCPVPSVTKMSSSWQTLPAQKGMLTLSAYLRAERFKSA